MDEGVEDELDNGISEENFQIFASAPELIKKLSSGSGTGQKISSSSLLKSRILSPALAPIFSKF